MSRRIRWFSAGAASAVATKLDIIEHGIAAGPVVYTDTGSEHPDNDRFRADCATWFGCEVVVLKSAKYASVDEVIEQRRYLNGPAGALCTVELKKKLRMAYQRPDDVQVFGYTADPSDAARADRFRENNIEVDLCCPLIDRGLKKNDCLALIDRAGITIPAMYLLGYANNNCIGCVKGGQGYWNKIRTDFPVVFKRRAQQEREIGASCLKQGGKSLFLDELDPSAGRHLDEPDIECSLFCATADAEIKGDAA